MHWPITVKSQCHVICASAWCGREIHSRQLVDRPDISKHDAFEVPLQYVSQCNAGKNDVTLEFSLNEEAPVNLAEMR